MSKWRKSKKPTAGDEEMASHAVALTGGAMPDDDEDKRSAVALDRAENAAQHYCDNTVQTCKYSLFPLSIHFILWKNLWEQFQKAANVYFLAVSICQVIPGLSPTGRFTTLIPLMLVLLITLAKDAWEDWKRRISDRVLNTRPATVYRNNRWITVEWRNVAVGDVCLVKKGDSFPADLVLLWASETDGLCYIETSNLDGETNLKPRKSPGQVYTLFKDATIEPDSGAPAPTVVAGAKVVCELPNNRLYNFDGYLERSEGAKLAPRIPLVSDNVLLRGSVLRNTKAALGLVIFTGNDTKLMRNSINQYHKSSEMDRVTNRQIFLVFLLQIVLSLVLTVGFSTNASTYDEYWYLGTSGDFDIAGQSALAFITFMILLNSLIPISLYVMLEAVRLIQGILINVDADMYCPERQQSAVTRCSKLNEQLGQVSFIFSDKTGTLTCNKMEFRQFSCFDNEPSNPGALSMEAYGTMHAKDASGRVHFDDPRINRGAWRKQRNKDHIRSLFIAMAVCHTVIPEHEEDIIRYQASSPDEACLVRAARDMGLELVDRNDTSITINDNGSTETWEILTVIEFSSNRKRMSVVVKDPLNRILLFCKGADNVVFDRLRKDPTLNVLYARTHAVLEHFAEDGLRTLVFARVDLTPDVFKRWKRRYDTACTSLTERTEKIETVAEEIEKDLELIGTTAIEDRLQDEVPQTIELLTKAGMKVWVLTGDKLETAINIGYACALLRPEMGLFKFDGCNESNIRHALEKYLSDVEAAAVESGQEIGLVIEGFMLHWILPTKEDPDANKALAQDFVSLASRCKAVICCRVSPLQKAQVVEAVQKFRKSQNGTKEVTLAIGDGANDVSMIQTAHVGIGISGMEGLQAARSSDYSIAQFRFLKRLLLVHGRWSYRRIAKLVVFSFYKNMTLYMTQFWFCMFNMFTGQTLYDPWALASYNLAFTSFPIMAIAIFDRDTEAQRILHLDQFPELYRDGIDNRLFNTKEFWIYTVNALVHSLIMFLVPTYTSAGLTEPGTGWDYGIVGHGVVAYTAVLLVVTLKCGLETNTWTIVNFLVCIGSVYIWYFFLIVYCALFEYLKFDDFSFWYGADTRVLSHGVYWLVFLLVTVLALLRDFCYKYWKRNYDPSLVHCVQAFEAGSNPDFTRFDVRKAAPYLFPKHEVKAFKPSLAEGVGNFRFLAADSAATDTAPVSTAAVFVPRPEASPGRRRQKISDIIDDDI